MFKWYSGNLPPEIGSSGMRSIEMVRSGRRSALKKLGLAAEVAYVAPTILHLDRAGNVAVVCSNGIKTGGGKGGMTKCK